MSNGYNGWANYETWRVNLEVLDGMTIGEFGFNPERLLEETYPAETLGSALEMYVCELVEQEAKGFALDLAHSFLAQVDWEEIAQHWIDDYQAEAV